MTVVGPTDTYSSLHADKLNHVPIDPTATNFGNEIFNSAMDYTKHWNFFNVGECQFRL